MEWKPHITVATVVEDHGRFLMVEELKHERAVLNQPAGHLDPGESPLDACIRETLEETAFHFKPTAIVGVYLSRFERTGSATEEPLDITYLRFAFCGELGEHVSGQALDEGIVRTVWMNIDELKAEPDTHRSPLLLRCVEDYLAGRRYPLELITTDPSVALHNA